MNELTSLTATVNKLAKIERTKVAGQIMAMSRSLAPQFYKAMSREEVAAEMSGIELCLTGIDQAVIAKMCEIAILDYPTARSRNDKTYFDINFLLTKFESAYNALYNTEPNLSGYSYTGYRIEFIGNTEVCVESWKNESGDERLTRWIVSEAIIKARDKRGERERVYSPRYYAEYAIVREREQNAEFEKMKAEQEREEAESKRLASLTPEQMARELYEKEQGFERLKREASENYEREMRERNEQKQAEREREVEINKILGQLRKGDYQNG